MKLTIFDRSNSGTTPIRTGVRSIYINRKNGGIMFSNTLRKEQEITVEQTVCFAKDEDSKTGDWYVCFNGGEDGLALRQKKNSGFAKECERTIYFCTSSSQTNFLTLQKRSNQPLFLSVKSPFNLTGKTGSKSCYQSH